jgi:hypothetical protein
MGIMHLATADVSSPRESGYRYAGVARLRTMWIREGRPSLAPHNALGLCRHNAKKFVDTHINL